MSRHLSVRGQMFLQILKRAKYGTVELTLPDGKCERYGEGNPVLPVTVNEWSAMDLMFSKGDLGLAEAIVEGTVVVEDTAALVEWACRNDQALGQALSGSWYGTLAAKVRHFMNRHDRTGSVQNTIAHYDLGNEFYRLWLDPSMTYSSALFTHPQQNLGEAQNAKYDRIIETLGIKSGDHLLEIGCGWGGFFTRAVEKTGCRVTAIANSPEQVRYNRKSVSEKNLTDHVTVMQKDYRDIEGRFDKVVSIEMIEAVGEKNWNTFFAKMSSSLKNKGQAVLQGITIREDLFYSYRKNTDFIQQYIFPGGMLITNGKVKSKGEDNGLHLQDVYEFGIHYADTLKIWRENFNRALPHVRSMGFDDKFIRMWNLYLSYCEGAFRAQRINVGQFLLTT